MKIVHVEDYFDPTAGYQINELLNASKKFNDQVYLITSNCMKPFHKKLDIDKDREFEKKTGVKIIRLEPKFIIASRVFMKGLYKIINDINPDVVFFHGIGDFKDLLLWKRKQKYKIIRDCHMSWVASQNRFRKLYYKLFKIFFSSIINKTDKYQAIYALGDEEYEYLKALGISDNKIDYLCHGYNDEIMYYDKHSREEIRNKYSIDKDDIVISYIGKFNEYKRPDLIFNIVNQLDNLNVDCKNLKLLFIGPKQKEYMNIFNENMKYKNQNIECIIDDAKPFYELRKYYAASDICIFPKECTLSAIHAQVCGSYVIMEKYKSNIERVIDNTHLYEIDNIKEASEILRNLINTNKWKTRVSICGTKLEQREYKKQVKYFMENLLDIEGDKIGYES